MSQVKVTFPNGTPYTTLFGAVVKREDAEPYIETSEELAALAVKDHGGVIVTEPAPAVTEPAPAVTEPAPAVTEPAPAG